MNISKKQKVNKKMEKGTLEIRTVLFLFWKLVFLNDISFKENKEDIKLINRVSEDLSILNSMSTEELIEFNNKIDKEQEFLDRKIEVLKSKIQRKKASMSV